MTMYDITPVATSRTAVFPGDTPLAREVLMDMHNGDNITLSTIRSTVHVGAHADAPSHYGADGRTIEQQPLEPYLGRCQVIDVRAKRHTRITPADLVSPVTEPRILLRTGTWPDPEVFNTDFAGLSLELIEHLVEHEVLLIGVDTPSVDLADSKNLPAHRAIYDADLAILECVDLSGVPDGVYELIALPLALEGFDASPVRAVLRTI